MLGISIYPEKQSKKEIIEYLHLASKYNFRRVFSCLLSVPQDKEKILNLFKEINKEAQSLNMEVILDVSPRVFNHLNISYDNLDFFKNLNADGIRLDMSFDGFKEAQMTHNTNNLKIELNMSSSDNIVDLTVQNNPNIKNLLGSHNFYPQRYTGLEWNFFLERSEKFKKYGIETAAFINSHHAKEGPWALNHGLPSVEMIRDLKITTQAQLLWSTNLIDNLIIGNAFASEAELQALSILNPKIFSFSISKDFHENNSELENEILFQNKHFRRGDTNAYSIRSTQSRVKYKNEKIPPKNTPRSLSKGDIVICNENYMQYKGELQIILKEQENIDLGKNLVGRISEDQIILLEHFEPLKEFKFEKN
ncbi:DUF871 domain-containing protein [Mycoplasma sp. Ms02]|uniref:DUF871 domain-containing protein n=1 Tax=Mycoplasma sp. Ms02 TaxID=353851 RepID=UPI001C8A2B54|nr:MupG family TIM beta-alpha barrel fold protein [Mycoplasma sp. Ms02]QZE12309.1 DUF871 family protein [Mycoplasma sp. Ms02]